jgi:hypothetical protein
LSNNLVCTPAADCYRRLKRRFPALRSGFHNRIPRLRTASPACLHSLSTALCTARLDRVTRTAEAVVEVRENFTRVVRRPLGPSASHGFSRGLPSPTGREPSYATSPTRRAQVRDKGERVPLLLLLIPLPGLAVVLVPFLVALLKCDRDDIPAIMTSLTEVMLALRRWRRK